MQTTRVHRNIMPKPAARRALLPALAALLLGAAVTRAPGRTEAAYAAGYLIVPMERVPENYNGGFSMYVAAWPLLRTYPGNRFQTGLFGTWMFAQHDGPRPKGRYSDIEGGLGWWRDTQYATETPKFIMGGVALNFCAWANGPGAGKGRDWKHPAGKYGVAQLSPRVLWPPDGLNLKQGTCGELFGYGYLPLPLLEAKTTTAGKNVPTGDQCWTLFLNAGNFKGPVAFFTPHFFSAPTLEHPELAGTFLDSRPSEPNRALQMETQHIPCFRARDRQGHRYARIAPTSFPRGEDGRSTVVHEVTAYDRRALWDGVCAWFAGGPAVDGRIDPAASVAQPFTGGGRATWQIRSGREEKTPLAWERFATPGAPDPQTYAYRWDDRLAGRYDSPDGPLVALPEYYRLEGEGAEARWIPIPAAEVPEETGLAGAHFGRPKEKPLPPYVTPDDPASCWKKPGPVAGPFEARPGDGSVVTYYWYRFADQPALLNADLTDAEREALQAKVEQLHRHWSADHDYLPPPQTGKLADIDPALLVTPPPGLEVGYVPIATRQGPPE